MTRRLQWAPHARADLDTIGRSSPATAGRIRASMQRFATENVGDVVKLAGQGGLYRLRVGDWRVIFAYEDGGLVVLALRVLNRRDAIAEPGREATVPVDRRERTFEAVIEDSLLPRGGFVKG